MGRQVDPLIHIGEEYGIYIITGLMPNKDKYDHYVYIGTIKNFILF